MQEIVFDHEGTVTEVRESDYAGRPYRAFYLTRVGKPGSPRPVAIEAALGLMGFDRIVLDEELSGDGRWHMAAFDSDSRGVARDERVRQLQELSQQTGSNFDGGVIVG
ncbi:MAG: hypothetical protein ACFCU2_09100 [Acidimicrobiia bacterium]